MKNSYKKILFCALMLEFFSLQTMHAALFVSKKEAIRNLNSYKIAQDIMDGLKGKPSSFTDADYKQELQEVISGGIMKHREIMNNYPDGKNYLLSAGAQLDSMGKSIQKKCVVCGNVNGSYKNSTCGSIKCRNKNICLSCLAKTSLTDQKCPSCKSKMNWNTVARHVAKK